MQWIFWVISIIIAGTAGYWLYIVDKRRAVPYPWLTGLLRGIVIFLTLLLILVPVFTINRNETKKPVIVLLQDDSRSIGSALKTDSAAYRKNVQELARHLSDKYKVVQWAFGNTVKTDSLFNYQQQATDISVAMSRVQDYYGNQNLGAVILATDGRFNQGTNPLYQQLALHSPVYSVAIGDSAVQKDIRITQTYANRVVALNNQFEIRADVIADLCNGYNNTVTLQEAGNTLATASLNITNDRYDHSLSFTLKAAKAGLHHYTISAPAATGETNVANNRKDVFVDVVDSKKNILILSAAPHPDVNAIREALSGVETYKVMVKTLDNTPSSFNDYQVIILYGLPSQGSSVAQQVKAANKPVWYILGSATNMQAFNQQQKAVTAMPAAEHDELAVNNTGFNTFTLPQNIQAVLDKMPPLSVPAGTVQAAPNAIVLLKQKENGNPLWLFQQGSVPTAVLTGEGLWRWRLYEYKNFNQHNTIDELIRQTISFLSANSNEQPFQVSTPKYIWSGQEAITLNAYLLNANNEQISTPDAQLVITDSAGHKHPYTFEHSGNAYNLNIGTWAGGTYNYTAFTNYNGKNYTAGGSFVVESQPLEAMQTGADYHLLYSVSKKYGGALVPANNVSSLYDSITHNENIKPVIQTITDTAPLVSWKWYFFLILLFAVAEWLLRKYWLAQ